MAAYEATTGAAVPTRTKDISPGTWRWLCIRYFRECAEYKRLDARTQHVRRQILEATFDEPIAPASSKFFRDFPLSRMTADAVEVLRDRKIDTPESATARVKAMRQVFKFGVKKSSHQVTRAATLNISSRAQPDSIPGRRKRCCVSRGVIQLEVKHGSRWH